MSTKRILVKETAPIHGRRGQITGYWCVLECGHRVRRDEKGPRHHPDGPPKYVRSCEVCLTDEIWKGYRQA